MTRKLLTLAIAGLTLGLGYTAQVAQAHPDYGCSSCHVAHNGGGDNSQVPLWEPNNYAKTVTLTEHYQGSNTLNATDVGTPDGASKLCLGCHDGTNSHMNAKYAFGAEGTTNGRGSLAHSHPVSFVFDATLRTADGHLKDPASLDKDVLDSQSKVQCTSCHQVHKHAGRQDIANLRWAYPASEYNSDGTVKASVSNSFGMTYNFCTHCHDK